MKQFDQAKLAVALTYIERMAEGKNPVKNVPVEADSVLNDPNVIRCMYFVKEVLGAVKNNKGFVTGRMPRQPKEPFPFERLADFRYESDKSVSHFLAQIHQLTDEPEDKKISVRMVTDWLKVKGYLVVEPDPYTGKTRTRTTEQGGEFGLYMETHTSLKGDKYDCVIYSRKAQEFLAENLEKIVKGETL